MSSGLDNRIAMRIAPVVVAAVIGCGVAVLTQSRMGTPADEAAILKNRDAQNAAATVAQKYQPLSLLKLCVSVWMVHNIAEEGILVIFPYEACGNIVCGVAVGNQPGCKNHKELTLS